MVNTTMNHTKEFKPMKYTWIDIDAPRQEVHFKPINESEEKPAFKYQQGASTSDRLKSQILATTLFDAVMKYRSNLVKEEDYSNDELYGIKGNELKNMDDKDERFFAREEWKEFERHGKMIAQFMGANDAMIKQALENMKTAFSKLGEGSVERGFDRLNQLDNAFKRANIDNLEPKIRVSRLLEMLSPEYNAKGKKNKVVKQVKLGKDEQPYEYSVTKFINRVLNPIKGLPEAMNGAFNGKNNPKLIDILKKTNGKSLGDDELEIFRKIVKQDKFTKNNAAVGKVEIALAMFFSGCRLADSKGDIELNGTPVEIKGSQAIITERVEKRNYVQLDSLKWTNLQGYLDSSNSRNLAKTIRERIGNLDVEDMTPENHVAITKALSNETMDEPVDEAKNVKKQVGNKRYDNETLALQFIVLFGALARMYFQGKVCNGTDGYMLIFDTEGNLGDSDLSNSKLLNAPIVKIKPDFKVHWIEDGARLLNILYKQGKTVQFGQAHDKSQGAFKVVNI